MNSIYRLFKKHTRKHLMQTFVGIAVFMWVTISTIVYFLESPHAESNIHSWGDSLWWGIVTFFTVGYGDRYPVTTEGRIFGAVLMFCGVLGIGILTAKISSFFLEQALRLGRGEVDTERLRDHFVVCGWKEDMHEILMHILEFNPGLESEQLVMIANVSPQLIDEIRTHPKLKDVAFVVGDYFHEMNLKRAAVERARKVLILADRTKNAAGQVPGITETDARTIMTAMTISNIAKGTLVAAELLDPKMDQYLKLANVSEIIYSREYSRLMLGNASGGTGIANIVFDLLDSRTAHVITTMPISDDQLGKPYPEFRKSFETKHPECVVIGVLENTGNSYRIKEMALREAQKTPDVTKLVKNLKAVKEMRCNHPVFNPSADYKVSMGSLAIVVENRHYKEHRNAS